LAQGHCETTDGLIVDGGGGDFDNDGDVDGADFLYWQLNDGSQSDLDK
jgi:hypothetical protein